jgi:hypothetical protein
MNNVNRRKTDGNLNLSYNNDDNIEMNNVDEGFQDFESNNVMRRHSDNSQINSQTLININPDQPMGLDLNNFLNNVQPDQTIHSISQSNDLPIIAEVCFKN